MLYYVSNSQPPTHWSSPMSASKSHTPLTTKQRCVMRRLQWRARRQHGVLNQIEMDLKGPPIFLPGIPTDVVEMHAVFGYIGDDLGYYTEVSLRYRLETEEWWLVKRHLHGGSFTGSAVSSREPRFWRDLRAIPPERIANAKLHWGEIV